jgi:hypothetical protein
MFHKSVTVSNNLTCTKKDHVLTSDPFCCAHILKRYLLFVFIFQMSSFPFRQLSQVDGELYRQGATQTFVSRLKTLWRHVSKSRTNFEVNQRDLFLISFLPSTMDQITIKTPNPKCRLCWCLIEFIDWKYSQSC